jgi:hypothetical protein
MIADRVAPTVILGALERAGFRADRTVSLGIFRKYVATRIH